MLNGRGAALLVGWLVVCGAHAAEPALESVTVEARVEAGRPTSISMNYFLRPAGATAVGFTSIRFGAARAVNVRAFLGAREVSFRTAADSGERLEGVVELPADRAGAERLQLRLLYEVLPEPEQLTGGPFVVTLPLLVSDWAPSEARPETFQATVYLPVGTSALAAFPTEYARVESIDRTSEAPAYRFDLPVVPALLRVRAAPGEPPLVTAERAVDLAAVALLVGLAVVGWRRLRESLT